MRKLLIIALVAAIAGCATTAPDSESIGPKPVNYENDIRSQIKTTFFDPYSLRDVSISEPMATGTVFDGATPFPHSGWLVCMRANGKNRMGAYTGLQTTVFLFKDGSLDLTLSGPEYSGQIESHCAAGQFRDFKPQLG